MFLTLAQTSINECHSMTLSTINLEKTQDSDLAPIFGDLSQSKLSKIKSPLEKCSRAADQDLLINLF